MDFYGVRRVFAPSDKTATTYIISLSMRASVLLLVAMATTGIYQKG